MNNKERFDIICLLREMYPLWEDAPLGHLSGEEALDLLLKRADQFEERVAKIRKALKKYGM